jgi:hypothetical protein
MGDLYPGGWFTSSTFKINSRRRRRKRLYVPRLTSGPCSHQTHQLQGDVHDGRRIPRKPYSYRLHGRRLKRATHRRVRQTTKRIKQHLRIVSSQLDRSYKSMLPFPSGAGVDSEGTPDTTVQVEHGLVYRVLAQDTFRVYSTLMYTFYTPLDFLEYPQTGSAREDDLVPGVPGEPDGIQTPLSDSGDESETDESDTDTDEPDGTGNTTTCKHDSTLQRLICAGASSHLSHSLSLVVDDAGEITCTGSSRNYRPGQFLIINDSTNNTDDKHIVSIQCVGWGPGNWFLAIVQERTNEWTFKVEVRETAVTAR